jgi:maleylacetoacetate isomerase
MMRLHNFHLSSTSFRVRIALALKGLEYECVPVALRWKDGDQDRVEYQAFNPQANVPVLEDGDARLVQSLAIFEYLDEKYPEPPILPRDPLGRARVRSLALFVACEIQPLNNLRTERFLASAMGASKEALRTWRRHWIATGFDVLERLLAGDPATGKFCHGDSPTIADCSLVPQIANALRPAAGLELGPWPTIARIHRACLELPAFQRALPDHQPDHQPVDGH